MRSQSDGLKVSGAECGMNVGDGLGRVDKMRKLDSPDAVRCDSKLISGPFWSERQEKSDIRRSALVVDIRPQVLPCRP